MYKPFYKSGWKSDKSTPITAAALDHFDAGLVEMSKQIAALQKKLDEMQAAQEVEKSADEPKPKKKGA